MSWGSALAIFALFWTVALFVVLPIGVRTSHEAGSDPVPGEADSAPVAPMIWRKLLWSALLAAVVFGLLYVTNPGGWLNWGD